METTTSKNPGCATGRACLACLDLHSIHIAGRYVIRNGHGNGARHCVVDILSV
jgi:hypothetical protein